MSLYPVAPPLTARLIHRPRPWQRWAAWAWMPDGHQVRAHGWTRRGALRRLHRALW